MPADAERVDPAVAPRPGVSVVVPAYNVGPYLDRCLKSLVGQSLDRSRYDVIAVDDGSTDGTAERLDRAAEEHPDLVRVVHIPNSGWPGRPRNVGTDLSTRDYVFYCDADDWLPPDALETMLDRAAADDSDVVMGRPVGNGRAVPVGVYSKGDRCTDWRETPGIFTNLTCQKMFRRAFLTDRGVRFGEGRVRLEDFLFMTTAYLRAERISIVGSRPCYVFERRDDGGNVTAIRATEDEYYGSVEKIIDIILAETETEAGRLQDLVLDRIIRAELVGHLSGPALLRKSPEDQAACFALVRRLLITKVPESAIARLPTTTQNWVRCIRRGDLDALVRRIVDGAAVVGSAVVTDVSWDDTVLAVDLAVALERDGEPLHLLRDGEALLMPLEHPDDLRTDVTKAFAHSSLQMRVRRRDSPDEWRFATVLHEVSPARSSRRMAWTATIRLDAHHLADGRQLPTGVWDLVGVLTSCGIKRQVRLVTAAPEDEEPGEPPVSIHQGVRVRPYWGARRALAFSVRPAPGPSNPTRRTENAAMASGNAGRGGMINKKARRLALASARRMGLTVTKVGAGQVLVSRSAAPKVVTLVKGRSWVVSKGDRAGRAVTARRLGDQHWVLGKPGAFAPQVDEVGSRGWLVSRPDTGALAEIHLENQTLQHLAARHVTWLLARYDVDLVLDVGANTGQYGRNLRGSGYRGRIASFEPVPHFADAVDTLAADDPQWSVHRIALGSSEGTVPIRVQRTFSSLLPASDYGKGRFGTLRDFADKDDHVVDVPLRRLETVLDDLLAEVHRADGAPPRVFLKMDTQGFDLEAFRGLGDRVGDIVGLQSEVALLLIYEGMPRMPEAIATYESAGFEISGMYPVTTEPDGRVIEYDCVMVRAAAAPAGSAAKRAGG